MLTAYERPRLVSPPVVAERVDNEWVAAGVIVALAAIGIYVTAQWVTSVCSACGTMGSVQDCYNTIVTYIFGGYC